MPPPLSPSDGKTMFGAGPVFTVNVKKSGFCLRYVSNNPRQTWKLSVHTITVERTGTIHGALSWPVLFQLATLAPRM